MRGKSYYHSGNNSNLPKIELKSPARIIEEKERLQQISSVNNSAYKNRVLSEHQQQQSSNSENCNLMTSPLVSPTGPTGLVAAHPLLDTRPPLSNSRHRSGTPTSTKSKVSLSTDSYFIHYIAYDIWI